LSIVELPLPAATRCVVVAVLDNVIVTDVVAGASPVEAEAMLCVFLHPVTGDVVVAISTM